MKTILSAAIIFCAMIFSANCQADDYDYYSVDVSELKEIISDWYDLEGNLVLTISNDYSINGCKILSVQKPSFGAHYKIKIYEAASLRDILLSYSKCNGNSDYHNYLTVKLDESNFPTLRRYKEAKYFESIGGIYLRMDKDQVISLYGEPSKIEQRDLNVGKVDWAFHYEQEGLIVHFLGYDYNIVTQVSALKSSGKKFDRSGLSVNSSKDDFVRQYNVRNAEKYNYLPIGCGEVICVLYKDRTVLCLDHLPQYL